MAFEYWWKKILSVEYNQDFVNSNLKVFWNVDFIARFAWFLGCELRKTSDDKTIKLNVQVWDRSKEIKISYDEAHKLATRFIQFMKKENSKEFDRFLDLQTKAI